MRRACLAVLAAWAAGAVPARAGEPAPAPGAVAPALRISVERLAARGTSPALAEAIEARLCAAVQEATKADVFCAADLAAAAALARDTAMLGGCATDDCLRQLDVARAADRRVIGTLARADDGLVLSLRVAGPDGDGPTVSERLPEDLDRLLAKVSAAARKLFP